MPKIYETPAWDKLLQRIKNNDPTLTKLDLSHNGIGKKKIKDKGLKELSLALRDNHILETIDLSFNPFFYVGVKELGLALKNNGSLTQLNLSATDIGIYKETEDLFLALSNNHSLIQLDLSNNCIDDKLAEKLSMIIKDNHTLKKLNLRGNRIEVIGAKKLSLALKDNHSLTELHLSGNKLGPDGAKELSLALRDNDSLTALNLNNNFMENSGAKDLSLALKDNRTLIQLELTYNHIDDSEIVEEIKQILARNQALIVQRRDKFIQAMLILARDAANSSSLSIWHQIPKELMLHIIYVMDFRSNESIGKSAEQIYNCAKFIFDHIAELNASLQDAIKTQQDFKIIENNISHQFSFFPKSLTHKLNQEENSEHHHKIQKTNKIS